MPKIRKFGGKSYFRMAHGYKKKASVKAEQEKAHRYGHQARIVEEDGSYYLYVRYKT